MANILDYLDWRGDLQISERGFNEVDNLLLAELCYLDFGGIVPPGFDAPVPLQEAMRRYDVLREHESMGVLVPDQIPELGRCMAASARFSGLLLCGYENKIDDETQTQFSALTLLLPDGTAYVAFRGTDDTIVGWKEDFNLAFLPVVPAQRMAVQYLQAAAAVFSERPLRVGGHSKGGNLAVYSAVFCSEAVQNQLMQVYNNDGPGFRTSLLPLPEHKRVAGRIVTIIPESSGSCWSMRNGARSCAARRSASCSTTASPGRCAASALNTCRTGPRAASWSTRRCARSSSRSRMSSAWPSSMPCSTS